MNELYDKKAVFQVIGCLIQKPALLDEKENWLNKNDFYEQFHKIVFAAINNLKSQGVEDIDEIMIDSFLSSYDVQYRIFNDNNGLEYVQEAAAKANLRNFKYNYNRVRKFTLLRTYKKFGFDVSDVYDTEETNPRTREEQQEKFDKMTVEDIVDILERKMINIRKMFVNSQNRITQDAADGNIEQFEGYKKNPDFGISLIGALQNTIFRGAKKGTVTLRSAPTNLGKTRIALAEATDMAVDSIYDSTIEDWVSRQSSENVLYISTEMEPSELRPTIWAYIADVPEEKIRDGACSPEEEKRVLKAIEILERAKMKIDYIPDFNTELIETVIKEHILENEVEYVYFDYVHISVQILEELANKSKGMTLREDMVLFIFIYRLVELAKRYDVYIMTASQVNGEWKNAQEADQNLLRGAKSMADKVQKGIVALKPTNKDLESLQPIYDQINKNRLGNDNLVKQPNVVYHIYKNRMTKHKNCKLWLHVHYDTMRIEELFLTTNDYKRISLDSTVIETKRKQES
ncbi:DnaB-like helicase C-terminal domain-containing protein [Shouchella clausii]|uniref:DnaB-like helicase C-terminal domain-containing protein n=1 Tax=Shouchella clausii TaxID=79880 RepID=UPI002DBB6555|nr:DnaB-like helicase C-terminal domain-containing protein [Shouchella clausii]MEB5480913.1 DnaB-like helicase C-terminal domain-containing protein [Shouchella clausii]